MRVIGKGLRLQLNPKGREGTGLRRRQQKVPQREWTGRALPPQPPTPTLQKSRSRYTHVSLSQKSLSSCFRSLLLKIRMAWRPASGGYSRSPCDHMHLVDQHNLEVSHGSHTVLFNPMSSYISLRGWVDHLLTVTQVVYDEAGIQMKLSDPFLPPIYGKSISSFISSSPTSPVASRTHLFAILSPLQSSVSQQERLKIQMQQLKAARPKGNHLALIS